MPRYFASHRERNKQSIHMNRETTHPWCGEDGRVRASYRSTWLGWTDPQTGDQLMVRMSGASDFISELVSEGFEPLDEPGPSDPRSGACRTTDVPAATTSTRRFGSLVFAAQDPATGNRRAG
jgi:hypothetical protein